MNDKLRQLMQESKERGPRQERPLAESSLKSIAEDYDPVSAWVAVSMAQEILRLRTENAAMRPIVAAVVANDMLDHSETNDVYCVFNCTGGREFVGKNEVTRLVRVQYENEVFYHAPDCPAVLAAQVMGMKE